MAEEKTTQKAYGKDALARKGGGRELREGEKPSAPANLVLPKPVKVPPVKSDKK